MGLFEVLPMQIEAHKRLTGVAGRDQLLIFLLKHDPKGNWWDCYDIRCHDTGKIIGWQFWVTDHTGLSSPMSEGWYCVKEYAPYKGFYPCNPKVFETRHKAIKPCQKKRKTRKK